MRLDTVLAQMIDFVSRARLKICIESGLVQVDGVVVTKPRHTLLGGEVLSVALPERESLVDAPEDIALDVVFEDDDLLIINKPAGLVVHPGAGNTQGTLLNALLHRYSAAATLVRAGIVHRLDKLTSGLMVVAKTEAVQLALTSLLKTHEVVRIYNAIVVGQIVAGGTVEAPIARHGQDRTKMAVNEMRGRDAVTHYRVMEKFRAHTHVRCQLETGRTHQIRVHMAHIGFPLLGDSDYGRRLQLPRGMHSDDAQVLRHFKRQALHAAELLFVHPVSGEQMHFLAPMPDDMQQLLMALRHDQQAFGNL
jgi:23S rRNA pseudouridine1911/1915/1917 synthase